MSRCYNIATSALANSAEGPGHSKRFNSSSPPSFLSAKTLQHCKHTGLNQAYFTRSLIINTSFASSPGVNFIRKKARVCGSIASLLYAVCLYRAYWRWTLSLHIYIMNSCFWSFSGTWECIRSNLRESKIQKFSGGTCPQTPLDVVCLRTRIFTPLPPLTLIKPYFAPPWVIS